MKDDNTQRDYLRAINSSLGKKGKLIIRTEDGKEIDTTSSFKMIFKEDLTIEVIDVRIAHYQEDWTKLDLQEIHKKIEKSFKKIFPKSKIWRVGKVYE